MKKTIFFVAVILLFTCKAFAFSGAWGTGGSANISDDAYGAGWNGATTDGASKNALYDKIETIVAGTTNYDDIGDPEASPTINFAGYTNTWTSTLDTGTMFTFSNTDADLSGVTSFIDLKYTDDGDVNGYFMRFYDNSGADLVFSVGADGAISTGSSGTGTITLGSAGVEMEDDGNGALTITGNGDGSDEDITLNFNNTANTVSISSSTGVTSIDAGSIALVTTGEIKGRADYGADITGATSHDTAECHNAIYHFTAAATVTLDAAADAGYGSVVSYRVRDAAEEAVIDIQAAEKINLDGTAQAAGVGIKATGVGKFVTLVSTTDTDGSGTDGWEVWGNNGFTSE